MKTQIRTLDEIAITKSGYKLVSAKSAPELYIQKMQSRQGKRTFELVTRQFSAISYIQISLYETWENGDTKRIGMKRFDKVDETKIKAAIKSLEKKAKCKLYYVLLISTDGEYL